MKGSQVTTGLRSFSFLPKAPLRSHSHHRHAARLLPPSLRQKNPALDSSSSALLLFRCRWLSGSSRPAIDRETIHSTGPLPAYERLVREKKINDDPSQRRALQHLQRLHDQLLAEWKEREQQHAKHQPAGVLHEPHQPPPGQEVESERAPWWKVSNLRCRGGCVHALPH